MNKEQVEFTITATDHLGGFLDDCKLVVTDGVEINDELDNLADFMLSTLENYHEGEYEE